MEDKELVNLAMEAKKRAYAPYSNFHVGAALLCENGEVYLGCNIENAAYGSTNCAERTAVFNAISFGNRSFKKIAIVSDGDEYTYPCGVCRQVLSEFAPNIEVIMAKRNGDFIKEPLCELLPHMFSLKKRD